ncbi:uncharacterized protein LOC111035506 [Myzus persicae]|uniref:uncharacterized protein LOC111035506 n=1 Tax=Myzus persicae TaxID=13164 RepID=UPI000B938EC0|nr:uncharacterized protein LOC111035506 [Myzus persicae]
MSIIKTFFNFLIFGKIIPGSKEQEIFEERATDENSIRHHFTKKLKIRDDDDSSEAICQVERDIGYMATMFPFSPPGKNNILPMEEICDNVEAQINHLIQVKRKRDLMISKDETLFKKHKQFASVLKVDPTTELEIPLAESSITNNWRPVRFVVRSTPIDIPKKRYIL